MTDTLDQIAAAAALLAEHGFEDVAEHVRSSPELFAAIAEVENRPGRSARAEAAIKARNVILRDLAASAYATMPAAQRVRKLSEDLGRYYTTSWPRDRARPGCPYPAGSVKAGFWEVLRLVPRALGERQMRAIVFEVK